ncbi:MAG: class I SAM-dependent methyltransferase [Flavobacteriaceae bacterium]
MNLFLKTEDYAVSGEEFELIHDPDLDMLVTRPQPAELQKYYDSKDYISHTDSKRNFVEYLYQQIKKYSLQRKTSQINRFAGAQKKLLDVGAGTGDFLSAARKRGWTIEGVEPNRMARGKASEKKIVLKEALDDILNSGDKFEVITLWHVLEHLPQLDEQIKKLVLLLEEQGTLFIAVPNFRSYDAQHYQNFWAAYDVPRHLWHFSRRSIASLFARHGMQIIDTKPMIFDAFYVSLLSERYRRGKSNFLMAFYRGLLSNLKAWRTKEYSSLLYILQKA